MGTVGIATGAGRGMGKACAALLADAVDVLLLADIDAESAAATAKELSGRRASVEAVGADVSSPEDMARLASAVSDTGALRAVAHAAGISPTMAAWDRVLTVDLYGTALLVETLRPLVVRDTAVVCFASMAPLLGSREWPAEADEALDSPLSPSLVPSLRSAVGPSLEDTGMAYSYAKRGVQRFVRREASWFGSRGARINSVSPGIIDTPQGRQEAEAHPTMAMLVARSPLAREGLASEVASVVSFLLSDQAAFVTGTDVLVDGGVVACLKTAPR